MLISCPECGRQISDSATTCPHCGFYRGRKCNDCEYFINRCYDEENGYFEPTCTKGQYIDENMRACNKFVYSSSEYDE